MPRGVAVRVLGRCEGMVRIGRWPWLGRCPQEAVGVRPLATGDKWDGEVDVELCAVHGGRPSAGVRSASEEAARLADEVAGQVKAA